MNTAVAQLFNLPQDKVEGDKFAEMLKKEIPAQRNPLNILVILKVFEKVLKDVLTDDNVDDAFMKDFKEHAENNKVLVNGANISSQEYGAKYQYDTDQIWTTLDIEIKRLTEQKKKREDAIKSDEIKLPGKVKVNCKL